MTERSLSLKEHLKALLSEMDKRYQQRFDDQTRAIDAAFQAAKEAVEKAASATNSRLEAMNEFRGAVDDQTRNKVNKEQFEAFRATVDAQVDALRELMGTLVSRLDKIEGRSTGMSTSWSVLVAIVGITGVALAIYTNSR